MFIIVVPVHLIALTALHRYNDISAPQDLIYGVGIISGNLIQTEFMGRRRKGDRECCGRR